MPPPVRRRIPPGLAARLLLACWLWVLALAAAAQGVELASLSARRADGALELEFSARVTLPKAVEDALWRGVPLYFVAEATLLRSRWYWRDERVARVTRSWRVAYQPLTRTWRVGLGGLNQSFGSLGDTLAAASSSSGWRLADLATLGTDKGWYVEFDYRLDTSQLPGPMQFGLGGLGQSGEWTVRVERVLRLD